jgi:D-alanine-D-alanine ligase-like ATP-grasp enzyme
MMSSRAGVSRSTRLVTAVSRGGRMGRVMAFEADQFRVTGLRRRHLYREPLSRDVGESLARAHQTTYRRIWEEAAELVGATAEVLTGSFLLLKRSGRETVVHRNLVMLDHPATIALALDKTVSQRMLAQAGLPVPASVEVDLRDVAVAERFLNDSPDPCVVKPSRETSGGTGVTCGVRDADDLWRARVVAGRWQPTMLIERQTAGDGYRLLFLDGELIGALRRHAPTVIGNGKRSIAELIVEENQRRVAAASEDVARLIHVDLDSDIALRSAGLDLSSVVPDGDVVTVKTSVSDNGLRDNEVVKSLSPELVAEAAAAARIMRLRLAGVDLVTTDPERSLAETGGTILEVNGTPGLHYHYQVSEQPTATPVAIGILERLLSD